MGIIGILIVVGIIYYLKHKQEKHESENEFQIQPDYTDISNSVNSNDTNPFIEQSEENNYQENSFVQDESNEEYNEYSSNGYEFPECAVNDKNFANSYKYDTRKFSYDNENYLAVSYQYSKQNLLLFQKVINENGVKKYHIVEYGFLWLKLLKVYIKACSILPHKLETYTNVREMPNVPDEQLEELYEIEKDVKSLYDDVTQVSLTFNDGTEKVFWKFGEVNFAGNLYHFLVSQTNTDDAEIFSVTFNGEGHTYSAVTNTSTKDMVWKAFQKKYNK